MKVKAETLKIGQKIIVAGKPCVIEETEVSDIGKQGVKKCRLVVLTSDKEKIVIVRPSDYLIELA
jgi:translation elongation factor P/translation initiation factor 5A